MHATRQQNSGREVWSARLRRSGYLIGALLLHLLVFLLLATLVVWKAPPPPPDDFHRVTLHAAPSPPQPPSSGQAANNPQLEPQAVVVPVVTPLSAITTSGGTFSVNAAKNIDQSISHLTLPSPQGSGLSSGGAGNSGTGSGFGSSTGSNAQLSGYFYDFKQTSNRKPTGMTERSYLALLSDYIRRGWDDSLFDSYYKSKAPLYTGSFAISTRPSGEAPKAFALENEVQPGLWIVHYRAKVEVAEAGEYRLAGFGDNVLLVKIDGTTVLDGGWNALSDTANLHQSLPFVFPSYVPKAKAGHLPNLKIGPVFHVDAAETMDMDVLIGDCGGVCSFFLLIEKVGGTYDPLPDGTPKLPFFQLGNGASPTFSAQEEHPPYSPVAEPWHTPDDVPEK